MKSKRFTLLILFMTIAVLLAACAGGSQTTRTTTGWPGLTLDKDQKTLYVSDGPYVYAINLDTGTEIWRFPQQTAKNPDSFYAPAVFLDNSQLLAASYNKTMYNLNPENAQANQGNWPFSQATAQYVAAPLVTSDAIYAPNNDNNLYALNLDGTLKWTYVSDQPIWATPAADSRYIYVPSMDRYLHALHPDSGQVAWKSDDLGGSLVGTPTLSPDDSKVFVGSFGSAMYAIDTTTGKTVWKTPTQDWVWSGPLLDGEYLYFGDLSGNLYKMDLNGQIVWKVQPDTSSKRDIVNKPVIRDGKLYFSSKSGIVFVVDPETGNTISQIAPKDPYKPFSGPLYAAPVLAGDILLVAPNIAENLVYAFDLNGNVKWVYKPEKK